MTRRTSAAGAGAGARFFFALRPDPSTSGALAALAETLAERFGGRPLAADDIHLTLAFVGMRPIDDFTALAAVLEGMPNRLPAAPAVWSPADADPQAIGGVPLALSRVDSFGHGVLWIGPDEDPPQRTNQRTNQRDDTVQACAGRLTQRLRSRLREARIAFDDRPLRLHATLVRGARDFHRADAGEALGARAIVPAYWTLALGWSDAHSTAQQRYRWHTAHG